MICHFEACREIFSTRQRTKAPCLNFGVFLGISFPFPREDFSYRRNDNSIFLFFKVRRLFI